MRPANRMVWGLGKHPLIALRVVACNLTPRLRPVQHRGKAQTVPGSSICYGAIKTLPTDCSGHAEVSLGAAMEVHPSGGDCGS
jgi:hypothetical protein